MKFPTTKGSVEFGHYLRNLRESHGLSLSVAAVRAGISPAYLSRLENGERFKPSREILWRLGKLYGEDYERIIQAAGYSAELEFEKRWTRLGKFPEFTELLDEIGTLTPQQARVLREVAVILRRELV